MPNGIVERMRGWRLGCRCERFSCESAALRELGDQTPMLGFCPALRLHLSVTAVALSLTACCLVRDINDQSGSEWNADKGSPFGTSARACPLAARVGPA